MGEVMDAVVDILATAGIAPIPKWVDDAAPFRIPVGVDSDGQFQYSYDVGDIFAITTPLGVPWKLGKCTPFGEVLTYHGFAWDLPGRTVSLPNAKRLKYQRKLHDFIALARTNCIPLRLTQSLIGTLSHITFMYLTG